MKKYIDIKELKTREQDYQKHYQEYCTAQWDIGCEPEWYRDGLNETPWLDVDAVYYNVSYSQGDYAYFVGQVDLLKFLDEKDTENEYFVLREAIELEDCADRLYIGQSRRESYATFDEIEWRGKDDGWFEDDEVVKSYGEHRSILEGMEYREYYDICQDLMGDLYSWVKEVCEQRMNKLYYEIREDIDHQMSEESFEEWAESMDEQFEIEVDDELEEAA